MTLCLLKEIDGQLKKCKLNVVGIPNNLFFLMKNTNMPTSLHSKSTFDYVIITFGCIKRVRKLFTILKKCTDAMTFPSEKDIAFILSETGMTLLSYYFFIDINFTTINQIFTSLFSSKKLKLFDYQKVHVQNILNSYSIHPGVLDTSETGAGKTYTTCDIAYKLELKMVVICPTNLIRKWKVLSWPCTESTVFTYNEISGTRGKIKHDYLELVNGNYQVTDLFVNMVKRGVLLVVDEAHKIKNPKSMRSKAIYCMIQCIMLFPEKSRIILLTATPFLKIKGRIGYTNMMKNIGLCGRHNDWYQMLPGVPPRMDVTGYNYLKSLIQKNRDELISIPSRVPDLRRKLWKLFPKVIKPMFVYNMKNIPKNHTVDSQNIFLNCSNEDLICALEMLELIENSITVKYCEETGDFETSITSLREIVNAITILETIKVKNIKSTIMRDLAIYPTKHIIVFCNRKKSVKTLVNELSLYDPLFIDGNVKKEKRYEIMDKFNEPTCENRLLIVSIATVCEGLDFDDKDGRYPRRAYIFPNYSMQNLVQATGRISRINTASDVEINMVYINKAHQEVHMFNNILGKIDILVEATSLNNVQNIPTNNY